MRIVTDPERRDIIKYFGIDPGATTKENRAKRKQALFGFRYNTGGCVESKT